MKTAKKSKKETYFLDFVAPMIPLSEVRKHLSRRSPDADPVRHMIHVHSDVTAQVRHDMLVSFISSGMSDADMDVLGIESNKRCHFLALHVVSVLIPTFDSDEFYTLLRSSLDEESRKVFEPKTADEILEAFRQSQILRLIRPANSRSAAVYGIVHRRRRPR